MAHEETARERERNVITLIEGLAHTLGTLYRHTRPGDDPASEEVQRLLRQERVQINRALRITRLRDDAPHPDVGGT